MTRISIMVAAHKDYVFPRDPGYLPIHVGRALSSVELPFSGDDSGSSISELNRSFCELTGLHWLWKNVDADIYGLVHYRRYFRGSDTSETIAGHAIAGSDFISAQLNDCDVVLSRRRNYWIESVRKHYQNAHNPEDLTTLEQRLRTQHPEYLPAFNRVMSRSRISLFNMFAMRAPQFDAYCTWLFGILLPLSNEIPWKQYGPYQGRVFGFLAERLLNVWVEHNISAARVCLLPVVNLEGESFLSKASGLVTRKLTGVKPA